MARVELNRIIVNLGHQDSRRGPFFHALYELVQTSRRLGDAPGQIALDAPDEASREQLFYMTLQQAVANAWDNKGTPGPKPPKPNLQSFGLAFAYSLGRGLTDWDLEGTKPELLESLNASIEFDPEGFDPEDKESRKQMFAALRDWLTLGPAAFTMLRLTGLSSITSDNPEDHVLLGFVLEVKPQLAIGGEELKAAAEKLRKKNIDVLRNMIFAKTRYKL